MLITCAFLLLLSVQDRIAEQCCKNVENTELVMAFLVHRHGDRTPLKKLLYLSDDPTQLVKMSEPYGYGELTDIGKARSYALGQFLRRRYNQLLSPSFNSSDIFVRATEVYRTQMTVKIAMTAVYSSKGSVWFKDMELVPLKIYVPSSQGDTNLPTPNCPQLMSYYNTIQDKNNNPNEMKIYDEIFDLLSDHLGFNLLHTPWVMYATADLLASQQGVGMPLSDTFQRLMPAILQASGVAANYIFGNDTYVPLQAGLLLQEFFDIADEIISGADIPRVRVLSAHDYNVYSFTAVSRAVPRQGMPGYCSVFSLELRRCKCNGEYVVVPVYVKSPNEPEVYLEIEDCGVICDYQKFRELTSKNVLTEHQYEVRCKSNDTTASKKK